VLNLFFFNLCFFCLTLTLVRSCMRFPPRLLFLCVVCVGLSGLPRRLRQFFWLICGPAFVPRGPICSFGRGPVQVLCRSAFLVTVWHSRFRPTVLATTSVSSSASPLRRASHPRCWECLPGRNAACMDLLRSWLAWCAFFRLTPSGSRVTLSPWWS